MAKELASYLVERSDQAVDAPVPDWVLDATTPLFSDVGAATHRALELLRWRSASDGPLRPFASLGTEFSVDGGGRWDPLPGRGSIVGWSVAGLPLTDRYRTATQALIDDAGVVEPWAHQLLREARQIWSSTPRSALVIAVAALEVGIKDLIASCVPDSRWLVENVPSPPVHKLLSNYLPLLPTVNKVGGEVLRPPTVVRSRFQKAATARNSVAHQGTVAWESREILDLLDDVQNTLYLFDFYAGHEWAWELLDPEYRDALDAVGHE